MGLALQIARRSLLGHLSRTFLSIVGIAIGISTVVCIFTLDHNTVLGRSISQDPDWQAEIEVSPSQIVQDPVAELARVQGVSGVTASFQSDALFLASAQAGAPMERVHLIALDALHGGALGAYALHLGGRPIDSAARGREVIVGQGLAERHGLSVGSSILLSRPARIPARECIEGEWKTKDAVARRPSNPESFTVVGVMTREGLGRRASGDVVLIDYRFGKELFEGTHVETRYWLKRDPKIDLENLQSNLGQAWSYQLKQSVIVGQAADERAFRNGVRFSGLLALVLGLYVIFHTLSMSIVERVREVGVLHALGATRAQIGRVFLAEAVCIAGGGGLVGLASGLFGARFLLRRGVTTVGAGEHISVFEVPWETVLPLVAAGVGVALLGSVWPLLRAQRTSTVAALRGEDAARLTSFSKGFQLVAAILLALVLPAIYFWLVPVIGESQAELIGLVMLGLVVVALFVSVPLIAPTLVAWVSIGLAEAFTALWPCSGKLAARAMQQSPTRVAGAVSGLALVTAGFVGLQGMTHSLQREIEVWGGVAFYDKVYARNLPNAEVDGLIAHLGRYPDVLGVEPGDVRTYVPFLLIGLRPTELAQYGPCRDEPVLIERLKHENGVILSRRLAGQQKYQVGDFVHVRTGAGEVVSLPVLAISDAYGYFPHPDERLYAVMSDEPMRRFFCIDTGVTTTAAIRLRPGADPALVESALNELYPDAKGLNFESGPYLFRWHTTDIARDFVLFHFIVFLTVLLAGVGMLNGQLLAALERTKELGILRALGTSAKQVAGMVLLECLVVGLLGGLIGAALGGALVPVIVQALQTISGLPLPPAGAGTWALFGALGAVAVALLAALYPMRHMQRISSVESIRSPG